MERIFLKSKLAKIITVQNDKRNFKALKVSNNYEVMILWKKEMNSFSTGFCSKTTYFCIIQYFWRGVGYAIVTECILKQPQ